MSPPQRVKTHSIVLLLAISALGAEKSTGSLDDPRQDVRDEAARRLRVTFTPSLASKWNELRGRLKAGISLKQVKEIIGPSAQTLKPGFGYMNGTIYLHRLDESLFLRFEIGRFEPGLVSTELVPSLLPHHTIPPRSFTGIWRDYFASGSPCCETTYREGKRHGPETRYHDNGAISQTEPWADDAQHGTCLSYFPSGKIRYRGLYERGRRSGTWIHYNEQGEEISRDNP